MFLKDPKSVGSAMALMCSMAVPVYAATWIDEVLLALGMPREIGQVLAILTIFLIVVFVVDSVNTEIETSATPTSTPEKT